MDYSESLRLALLSLEQFQFPPDDIRNSVYPYVDQARQILELAVSNGVEFEAAKETALVAHTCILSAVSKLKDELSISVNNSNVVLQYLNMLQSLVESWTLRDLALEYHHQLSMMSGSSSPSTHQPNELHQSDTTSEGMTSPRSPPPPPTYPPPQSPPQPQPPHPPSSQAAENAPSSYVAMNLPGETAGTAEIIYRHAEQAMVVAEQAALSNDRMLTARSFHFAVVFFETLRIFGELRPEVEARQRYAQWRARSFSHLLENFVCENLSERKTVYDVYDLDESKEGLLGSGSYGTVCLATHKTTKQTFACKQLKLNRATPKYVSKLYHEVSIMRELNHPNVVKLIEVFYAKRQIYLIMELASGGELFDLLTNQPGDHFSESVAALFMTQMLSAVNYLHSKGVVHRDLKLENFLLESKPSKVSDQKLKAPGVRDMPCLKLIDFGLSKHLHASEVLTQQVGSAYYVAPEVLSGQYNQACDLWSMGVILYMLVSGVPPFWGASDTEIRQKIRIGTYEFPEPQFQNVSASCVDLIRALMTIEPAKRLSAAQALEHPWVKHATALDTHELPNQEELMGSMQTYSKFSSMRKLMTEVIAFTLTTSQIEAVRDSFVALDTDKSGTIELSEMRSVFANNPNIDESELENIFAGVSVHDGHSILYNEFIASTMWEKIHVDEERIQHVFDTLDVGHVGYLTAETIRNVVGQDFSAEDVDNMMRECDFNGDGKVDYEEFEQLWKSYQMQTLGGMVPMDEDPRPPNSPTEPFKPLFGSAF